MKEWKTKRQADRLWSREAPQVIVVVPHFLSLQAVTQLERCDRENKAEEAEKEMGKLSAGRKYAKNCSRRKQGEK